MGFHPSLRACRCAESSVALVSNLVSLGNNNVRHDLSSTACLSDCQELPLQVSMAQRRFGTHHLLVLTMVPRSSTPIGPVWLEASWRLLFLCEEPWEAEGCKGEWDDTN